jgi:hypothetical protein
MPEEKNNLSPNSKESWQKIRYKIFKPGDFLEKKEIPLKESAQPSEEKIEETIFQPSEQIGREETATSQLSQPVISKEEIKKEVFFAPKEKESFLKSELTSRKASIIEIIKSKLKSNLLILIPLIVLVGVIGFFVIRNSQKVAQKISQTFSKEKKVAEVIFLPELEEVKYESVPTSATQTETQTEEILTETSSDLFEATSEATISSPVTSSEEITTSSEEETKKELKISFFEASFAPSSTLEFPFMNYEKITISKLDEENFKKVFDSFLSKQETFRTKKVVTFLYNNKKISYGYVFNYFFSSSKLDLNELVIYFTGDYEIIFYYGYSRKYPILIFQVDNPEKVINFNKKWEENGMIDDLKRLLLTDFSGKIDKKFESRTYRGIEYRIVDLGDNFKIIWSVAKNYLIYSTTESGFKDVVDVIIR